MSAFVSPTPYSQYSNWYDDNVNMSYNTGATFYPGGDDSYYMPEIVQPAPHRVADHPTNMPQNVAQMEDVAHGRDPRYSPQPNGNSRPAQDLWNQPTTTFNPLSSSPSNNQSQTYYQQHYSTGLPEQPNFSPFPIIRNPPPNIPPTDEQKEATLESARDAVLSSNDPETQLIWAQDALSYVEIAQQNEQRISATQPPRPRTPRIEHQLKEDAMKIVNFLADQRHPKAEFIRGMWLEFGKFGHRIDKKEAFHCYTRASEKGYARADYRIGMQFESSNDALKAVKYYQKGVDAGDSASCYRLGMMTLLGQHGQMQDFEHGLNLIYSSAQTADENAPQGAYVFGMLQARELSQVTVPERFLPKDVAAAKINIEKAAYLGFAKAQVKMGSAYELSELGCPFDPALSLHYNALAARQGEADAEMAISKWFLCGHEGVFEKSEEMAFTYAQRAAVGGLATAQFAMGYFYEVGIYVPVDFNIAKEWYRKASQNGNPDASGRIDAISRSKTLSRKDHETVALKKIRQHYGSISQAAPPMPTMHESYSVPVIDMPDPSKLRLNSPPIRPSTTTPYPIGPPNMPSAQSVPDFRPTSAFGINPNLRPVSAAPANSYGQQYGSSGGYGPPQQRPYSRADAAAPQGYATNHYRPTGGSPIHQNYPPHTAGPQRPNTTSGYLPHQGGRQNGPAPPSKVEIGYVAPPDPHGADRKQRPTYGVDPSGGRLRPPPQQGSNPIRTSSRPNPQSPLAPHSQSSGGRSSTQTPVQSRPQQPHPSTNKPANTVPQNKPVQQSAKPTKPHTVAPSTAGKPGKQNGPQSFDEMGIPRVKDKGDCIVM